MKHMQLFLLRHARWALSVGVVLVIVAGVYGASLFNQLENTDDNFFASGTTSAQTSQRIEDLFGAVDTESTLVLFETKDRSATITQEPYVSEVNRLLGTLSPKTVTSYYTTGLSQFVSKSSNDTYAVVTLDGTTDQQYEALKKFSSSASNDLVKVSVGGVLVGQQQTQEQAKKDLTNAEMISLPILALLLLWFFRSPTAAAIPLVMSALTIAGSLGIARLVSYFVPIDTYSLNVITILSVGLSVDYSLLAVNRFREELAGGLTPERAAQKTLQTAGRTIVFSGMTVIVCLLALLFFPVGFMRSVSIGGASAVFVAVLISVVLLPLALRLLGNGINVWSLKRRTSTKGWSWLAHTITKVPIATISVGVLIIVGLVWPVYSFQTKTFDWHTLPNNQSAYYTAQVIDERFEDATATVTLLATFPSTPTMTQLCELAKTVASVDGVQSIRAAYAPTEQLNNCTLMPQVLATMPAQSTLAEQVAKQFVVENHARIDIIPTYDSSDPRIRDVMRRLETAPSDQGVTIALSGLAVQSQQTLEVYWQRLPYVIVTISLAMIVILSLLLGSIVLPIQAIIINSLALFISLGVLIMIFQFGWGAQLLGMTISNGFELSIPILIFVMAFGLSMDYSVFLYSRMHEIYDQTGDPDKAIIGGVIKTGPIITAAALLMFAVVIAFAFSKIALIQQIGIGLSVAVLVDAFFVRIFFVPAVMKLFGHASWWGPAWLKKITIKHD